MSLLTHYDDGGDQKILPKISRSIQTLSNDALRDAYKIFGLEDAKRVLNDEY